MIFPYGMCECGRPLGVFDPAIGAVCLGCRHPERYCLSDESDSDCWVLSPQERSEYAEEILSAGRRRSARRDSLEGDQ